MPAGGGVLQFVCLSQIFAATRLQSTSNMMAAEAPTVSLRDPDLHQQCAGGAPAFRPCAERGGRPFPAASFASPSRDRA